MADTMKVSRKLVAVFAAGDEGYSRLLGADEVGTLRGLTERRTILDKLIGDYRGRIANTAGDSCYSAWGPNADQRSKCLIDFASEGSFCMPNDRQTSHSVEI